jgi:nicotinate-nucleotide pyrophosphorylase
MPLADFVPVRRAVAFPGGEFEVRALNLLDISMLIDNHRYAIDQIASQIRTSREMMFPDEDIIRDVIIEVIRESPVLVANVISLCCDERDQQEAALQLPATVQAEALLAIADLTFKDTAAIKKLAADVMRLIQGILPPGTVTLAQAAE